MRYYAPPRVPAVRIGPDKESALSDLLARLLRWFKNLPRITREMIALAAALLIGFVLVPLAIWLAGNRILGPYTHGANIHAGPLALLGDFYAGLGHGAVTFWLVGLAPAVLILFVRLVVALLRYPPQPTRPRQ